MSSHQEYFCYECLKKYPDFSNYQTHIKLKHRQSKQPHKPAFAEDEMADIEDKIYAFMGELSDYHCENARASESENILEENRFLGQANYLPNSIVRTPYEAQANLLTLIPDNYQLIPVLQTTMTIQQINSFASQINKEVKELEIKLKQERRLWEFADPLDQTLDFDNQFSILDVSKLLKNYPKRNLALKTPQISVFILWLGRICKPQMFRLVYELLVSYAIYFQDFQRIEKAKMGKKVSKIWLKFAQKHKTIHQKQGFTLTSDSLQDPDSIKGLFKLKFNEKNVQIKRLEKLLDLYCIWAQYALSICSADKKQGINLEKGANHLSAFGKIEQI